MSDNQLPAAVKKRTRSPGYPVIDLPEAIKRAKLLWDNEQRHSFPLDSIRAHWEIPGSSVHRLISALRQFGLLDALEKKTYRLSTLAATIIVEPSGSEKWREAVQTAALNTRIYAELYDKYGLSLPSDATLSSFLILEKYFNKRSVGPFIGGFRATMSFANLSDDASFNEGKDSGVNEKSATSEPDENARQEHEYHVRRKEPKKKDQEIDMTQELPIPVGDGRVVTVPYPMSEDDFEILLDTLNLWKRKLVSQAKEESDQE
jgi:hypothetical protein